MEPADGLPERHHSAPSDIRASVRAGAPKQREMAHLVSAQHIVHSRGTATLALRLRFYRCAEKTARRGRLRDESQTQNPLPARLQSCARDLHLIFGS